MRDFQLPGRSPAYAQKGMAATSHSLATLTAIDVLRSGGNAVDAAIAASAALCVVEPQATGIGGDCFVLYAPADSDQVIALNGSGKAPAAAELSWFLDQGMKQISLQSPHSVTVPGAVDAWCKLHGDYGQMDFAELLAPAIRLATEGYTVHPRVAYDWASLKRKLQVTDNATRMLLVDGEAPKAGDRHQQPELGRTLQLIAEHGRDAFYTGEVAEDIVAYLKSLGGLHTLEDFAAPQAEYVTPISTQYRGYDVFECPPNGQGLTALIMLNILSECSLTDYAPLSAERLHLECEAARLAYGVRDRYVADPAQSDIPLNWLLSKEYAAELRAKISIDSVMPPLEESDFPTHPDTVCLCVVDEDGNAVSFINSVFHGFGSGLVSPKTGVVLQNRGAGFVLEEGHRNAIAPHKRPLHTIIPGMLKKAGRTVMPFGVMGGQYQPTGHAHFLTNLLDYRLDVQSALDFPRVFHDGETCAVERGVPIAVTDKLKQLGHKVLPAVLPHGGGQAIWMDESGGLVGGSDPRKDGCALGYE
ncbi:gamma-glutamyltransferase [cf. Phormidesmis sp. LEGE 11477]|uniref:gamma-glutamyltransferase n=1 Tax=cf. Phormidesmis sp. LEGE 11477 TaxID=1828680 RepID=UPI00188140ED|nr:gamma-glutamyltransferase [cf. Phormidesmis sp. LEGE 11477]MBE9060030.1 gamma-glutamyltransferase [cf. Phormidesmis sp. LEGE 11477]